MPRGVPEMPDVPKDASQVVRSVLGVPNGVPDLPKGVPGVPGGRQRPYRLIPISFGTICLHKTSETL